MPRRCFVEFVEKMPKLPKYEIFIGLVVVHHLVQGISREAIGRINLKFRTRIYHKPTVCLVVVILD